jgi:hypothetical protein
MRKRKQKYYQMKKEKIILYLKQYKNKILKENKELTKYLNQYNNNKKINNNQDQINKFSISFIINK